MNVNAVPGNDTAFPDVRPTSPRFHGGRLALFLACGFPSQPGFFGFNVGGTSRVSFTAAFQFSLFLLSWLASCLLARSTKNEWWMMAPRFRDLSSHFFHGWPCFTTHQKFGRVSQLAEIFSRLAKLANRNSQKVDLSTLKVERAHTLFFNSIPRPFFTMASGGIPAWSRKNGRGWKNIRRDWAFFAPNQLLCSFL